VTWDGSTLSVAFDGRADVTGPHQIYWPGGNPTAACDGRPTSATSIDDAGHRYAVDCGGGHGGAHILTIR
jgi:hypothetical protein